MNDRTNHLKHTSLVGLLMLALLAGAAPGWAVVYNLRADATTLTLPGGVKVGMWGFALDSSFGAGNGQITIPGPALTVPPGDGTLTVRLKNNLTQARTGVPGGAIVSLIVPALPGRLSPVFWGATPYPQFQGRVRSLNTETAPGNTSAVQYTWTGVPPGTYLYHSGTQMQVQVQMGLYGAITKDDSLRTAYAGVPYDQEATLLYSEIDTALHQAVVRGEYGPGKKVTSTIDYHPNYFLINGIPFTTAAAALRQDAWRGRRLRVRLLNAGLQTHTATLNGLYWDLVAEDAKPYAHPRQQYSALLPAGKTLDAIVTGDTLGSYAVFDHTLNLVNNLTAPGGFLSYLAVKAPVIGAPSALANAYAGTRNTVLTVAAPGVLSNDSNVAGGAVLAAVLVSGPAHGSLKLNGDGSFVYTPQAGFSGIDSFTYRASNGMADSGPVIVTLSIS